MIRWTTFPSRDETTSTQHQVEDWSCFVYWLADQYSLLAPARSEWKNKHTLAITPAVYDGEKTNRCNNNVTGWASWIGLDIDNGGENHIGIDEMEGLLIERGYNYVIYTTTKSSVDWHRYRVIIPTTRELCSSEIKAVWSSVYQSFGGISDSACNDLSRLYFAPRDWQASEEVPTPLAAFRFALDGRAMDVDALVREFPPVVMPVGAVAISPMERVKAGLILASAPRGVEQVEYAGILDCPYPFPGEVDAYLSRSEGWYRAIYALGKNIAKGAAFFAIQGKCEFTADELARLLIELDQLNGGPFYLQKDIKRWARKIMEESWESYLLKAQASREEYFARLEVDDKQESMNVKKAIRILKRRK